MVYELSLMGFTFHAVCGGLFQGHFFSVGRAAHSPWLNQQQVLNTRFYFYFYF